MSGDINCRKDIREAYMYFISTIITSLLLNATTYYTMRNHQMCTHKTHPSIGFVSTLEFIRSLVPTCPAIAFIFLLKNLHKRFVALNSCLRSISANSFKWFFCDILWISFSFFTQKSLFQWKFAQTIHWHSKKWFDQCYQVFWTPAQPLGGHYGSHQLLLFISGSFKRKIEIIYFQRFNSIHLLLSASHSDNDKYSKHISTNRVNVLHFLPLYCPPWFVISTVYPDPFAKTTNLYDFNAVPFVHHTLGQERGEFCIWRWKICKKIHKKILYCCFNRVKLHFKLYMT